MKIVNLYLEAFILVLFAWVLSFEIVNYGRLPFATLYWLFPLLLAGTLAWAAPGWLRVIKATDADDWRLLGPLLLIGTLLVLLMAVFFRQAFDDVGYLHQPMLDSLQPDRPISWKSWHIPYPDARVFFPVLSKTEAYDPLAIVLAKPFGLHPLTLYHNILPIFSTLAWLAVYVLLLDHLGIRGRRLWLALLGLLVLLGLDGAGNQSIGNLGPMRIWEGKVIMMSVLLPTALLLALRALDTPRRRDLPLLGLILLMAPFISRSALFLLPLLLGTLALSHLAMRRAVATPVVRSLPSWAPPGLLVVGVAVMGLVIIGLLIARLSAADWQAFRTQEDQSAWSNLAKFYYPNPWLLFRDLTLLSLVPLLALRGPLRFVLLGMTLLIGLICFVPPWDDWLFESLTDKAYWRLYHLLPMPLMFALLPVALTKRPSLDRPGLARLTGGVLLVAAMALGTTQPVLSSANRVEVKWPGEHRIYRREREAVAHFFPRLEGRHVLAAHRFSFALSLTHYDSVKLSFNRIFANANSAANHADHYLSRCHPSPRAVRAIRRFIIRGADRVVSRSCRREAWLALSIELGDLSLKRIDQFGDYSLYRVEQTERLKHLRARHRQERERRRAGRKPKTGAS